MGVNSGEKKREKDNLGARDEIRETNQKGQRLKMEECLTTKI